MDDAENKEARELQAVAYRRIGGADIRGRLIIADEAGDPAWQDAKAHGSRVEVIEAREQDRWARVGEELREVREADQDQPSYRAEFYIGRQVQEPVYVTRHEGPNRQQRRRMAKEVFLAGPII